MDESPAILAGGAPDMARAGMSLRLADQARPGRRILSDMDGAPADDRAAASAGAEFRQCHSYRHNQHPVPGRDGERCGPISIRRRGNKDRCWPSVLTASTLTILGPANALFRPFWAASVPLLNRPKWRVNVPCRRLGRIGAGKRAQGLATRPIRVSPVGRPPGGGHGPMQKCHAHRLKKQRFFRRV